MTSYVSVVADPARFDHVRRRRRLSWCVRPRLKEWQFSYPGGLVRHTEAECDEAL
jgi:hypothetical protein